MPEGFAWTRQGDTVRITHRGRLATTLRGVAAQDFLEAVEAGGERAGQELMARVTGNCRRGNERAARDHPRNRGR